MRNEPILIVGTGFAGLGMGIRLKQAGYENFTILEQASGIGGTWRDNTYPGAACDIESNLYSFSFEPNPSWSRMFAPQAEILAYLERCTDKYGLRKHIRFNSAVTGAHFDESRGEWTVRTSDGAVRQTRVLISCSGGLSRPSFPEIAGLSRFEGKVFHSARWDHSFDLSGKRVAVIGTGASAIQIVPAIAPKVGYLANFQRTPSWIMPRMDRDLTESERERFRRFPMLQQLARLGLYTRHELIALGFVVEPRLLQWASRFARKHIADSVTDPVLREKVTPKYVMGCKRVLLSNDYYPALQRQNVELVTEGIEEITARGIRTTDGAERPFDAIVLATGFEAAEAVSPFGITGRDGVDLNKKWKDGPEAFLGTTIAGFPNLFLIVGPNTGLGHNSMVYMIESQIAYVMSSLQAMEKKGLQFVDVKLTSQKRFNESLQARLARTVWSTGCASWYRTRTGRNTTLWPGFTFEYRFRTRHFNEADYELISAERTQASANVDAVG
jgi:cation diffusion facilitator CzcD-associated flavoprotein CzcO